MGFFSSLIDAFTSNGAFFMWSILGLQIASMAIIAERVFTLYFKAGTQSNKLIQSLQNDIRSGDIAKAYKRSAALSTSNATARLAETALGASLNFGGREEIQARLQEALFTETSQLERRVGFLAVFANLATLLGLLGTIAGLIQSFLSISSLAAAEKSVMLSQGIALAMNTTAYGLIVAIPSLLMYAVIQSQITKKSDELSKAAMQLLVLLGFQTENIVTNLKKTAK